MRFIGFADKDQDGNRFSRRTTSSKFAWVNDNSKAWRQKVAIMAAQAGAETMDDLCRLFGPRWAFALQDSIMAIPLVAPEVEEKNAPGCPTTHFPKSGGIVRGGENDARVYILKQPVYPRMDGERQLVALPHAIGGSPAFLPRPAHAIASGDARLLHERSLRVAQVRPPGQDNSESVKRPLPNE